MYNVNEMTMAEVREAYLALFPSVSNDHLDNTTLKELISEIEEEEARLSKEFEENENIFNMKHTRSKKKKYYKEEHIKKSKVSTHTPKWKIPTTKPITDESTTNRNYLKKKSAGYIKLKPKKSL